MAINPGQPGQLSLAEPIDMFPHDDPNDIRSALNALLADGRIEGGPEGYRLAKVK